MSHSVFRFANFVIDPAARELWHGAERVSLPPKSFDCLAYLLNQRERAVGRDELISAVWGRVDVSDAVLAQTLLRARRAVGDTGSEQTTIRTVLRFGYRWTAPVDIIENWNGDGSSARDFGDEQAGVLPPADALPPIEVPITPDVPQVEVAKTTNDPLPETVVVGTLRQSPPRARSRAVWLVVSGALLLVLGAALTWMQPWRRAAEIHDSLAVVMPVDVADANAESAWIRLGAMDYVAARLREEGNLSVVPSAQVVTLIGEHNGSDPATIAHVAEVTSARFIVLPRAQHGAGGWRVQLTAREAGRESEADATATTPLEAAALASERLLNRLEIPIKPQSGAATASPTPLIERVQRIDAALLGGDIAEARRLVESAGADQRAEPALRVRQGQVEFRAGHVDEAERIFVPIAESTTALAPEIQAQAMMGLGAVAVRRGDFPLAEKRYAEALATLGDRGDPNLVGNAFGGRGVARGGQHHFDLAQSDLGRAHIAFERAGNKLDAADVETNLAVTENIRGRYAQALPHFDRAIAVHERFGVRDSLAADLSGKSHAQRELLDLEGALASSERASQIATGLENSILVRAIGFERTAALLAVGRLREAAATLAALPSRKDDPSNASVALLNAKIALAGNNAQAALETLRPLLADGVGSHFEQLPTFVAAALKTGEADLARQTIDGVHSDPADPADHLALELARALLLAGSNPAEADAHFVKALALADEGGVPSDRARAGSVYARFLIDTHQMDKASAVVGDLAAYADRDFAVADVTATFYHALGDTSLESSATARAKALAGERSLTIQK